MGGCRENRQPFFGQVVWQEGKHCMKEAILKIIEEYKSDFERVNSEERYKWEAIECYRQKWDINAVDFVGMLNEAFKKSSNLLAASRYYPLRMVKQYAEEEPEIVRELFKVLYDENLPLAERYKMFREGFDRYVKPKGLNHYQDLRAISVYLTFEYPEKYFMYKYKMYQAFKEKVSDVEKVAGTSDVQKLENYMGLCNKVLDLVKQDNELQKLSNSRLDSSCYKDEALHILTHDIIYFGSKLEREAGRKGVSEGFEEMELSDIDFLSDHDEEIEHMSTTTDVNLNTILYGPPGTGKTYHTVVYAVAIIENRLLQAVREEEYTEVFARYNEYKAKGWIEFTTFHQSYGYEEFIEGIKPEMTDAGNINYSIQSGVFKNFCEKANIGGVGFEEAWMQLISKAKKQKKYVFTRRTGSTIKTELLDDDTFVVHWNGGKTNALKKEKILIQWKTYEYSDREEVPQGGKRWLFDAYQAVIDELVHRYGMKQSFEQEEPAATNRVFVIDEINRGNISKIFGELITLIEPSKRIGQHEGMKVKLPYSQQSFGVPDNVYIIGTMNTADRSIATIDTALRRRFRFTEMLPDASILEGIYVEDISIQEMLKKMNKRIAVLYDREHTLGHAYFVPLKSAATIEVLGTIFSQNIIPLLQEYFYEDYEKIRMVLGDHNKSNENEQFIKVTDCDVTDLFGNVEYEFDDVCIYEINQEAFGNIEAYRKI